MTTLQIDAKPGPGVRVTVGLRQLPGSTAVSAELLIENKSNSAFSLSALDLSLTVDGVVPKLMILPHFPAVLEVAPGDTTEPGNGWQ